jgi:hypothetical protein
MRPGAALAAAGTCVQSCQPAGPTVAMADTPHRGSPRLPTVRPLRCLNCGRTTEHKPADLQKFTNSRWPRYCGDVMALFTPADPPRPPKNPPS